MLIPVVFKDGKSDMILDLFLQRHIDAGDVLRFRRRDGWVVVGVDPVRRNVGRYAGAERRRSVAEMMFSG